MELTKLLKPKSIAVVGASEKEGFSGDACRNILNYMNDLERVYFVNPRREKVFGYACYHSITEIPDTVDLLILCTPQKTILSLLEEGAKKGCGGAVIYASGYGETGTEEGRTNEKELLKKAEELGIAIMGPNCAGYVNYIDNVQAFAFISDKRDRKGSVGVISQSGQLCLSMMDHPAMKFSYNISAGNAKNVQLEDYMEFLLNDKDTKVISLYMEGVKNSKRFVEILNKAAQVRKPIVILKAGRSNKGQKIAASHTGSLSGSDASFDAVLKKYGAIRADDLEELIAISQLLSTIPKLPEKAAFASMNLSGGETAICADVGFLNDIEYPDFSESTLKKLKELLPGYATPNNPLDMTASLSYDENLYAQAFEAVMDEPEIGMVLVGYTLLEEIADPAIYYMYRGIRKIVEKKGKDCKPVAIIPFAENTRNLEYQEKLAEIGIPVLPPPVYAFKILRKLAEFLRYDYSSCSHENSIPQISETKTYSLSEYESKQKLKKYGIPVADEWIVTSAAETKEVAEKMSGPFAMKVHSKDILHKSDVGGVVLNVSDSETAETAFADIMKNAAKYCPDARVEGVLITPMLEKGMEMIIGVNNDPQFGPMLMVGMGGVFVEIFRDVAIYPAPLTRTETMKMIQSLKAYKLLDGYRGGAVYDVDALCDMIVNIGKFAIANKNRIKELDINPVFVYPKGEGVGIADCLIIEYGENEEVISEH